MSPSDIGGFLDWNYRYKSVINQIPDDGGIGTDPLHWQKVLRSLGIELVPCPIIQVQIMAMGLGHSFEIIPILCIEL